MLRQGKFRALEARTFAGSGPSRFLSVAVLVVRFVNGAAFRLNRGECFEDAALCRLC